MRTIDEAELAGWHGLDLHCDHCRFLAPRKWAHFRRTTTRRHLADIVCRLRCERCGNPPGKVWLLKITSTIGGDRFETAPWPPDQVELPGLAQPAAVDTTAALVARILRAKRTGRR